MGILEVYISIIFVQIIQGNYGWELVTEGKDEGRLHLEDITSRFTSALESEVKTKLTEGNEAYLRTRDGTNLRLTRREFALLQLIHALKTRDIGFSQLLLDLAERDTAIEHSYNFLVSLDIPQADVFLAVKNYAHFLADLNEGTIGENWLAQLNEEYSLLDCSIQNNDQTTTKWLLSMNRFYLTPSSIELLWLRGEFEVVSRVLNITKDETVFSKLVLNETFIRFVINNCSVDTLNKLLKLEEIDECGIVSISLQLKRYDFLEFGIDLRNCSKSSLVELLHASVTGRRIEFTKAVLGEGIGINERDHHGYTPLFNALLFGNDEVANFLVISGADYNDKVISGRTLLSEGVFMNRKDVVGKLLDMGVNPMDPNEDNSTAFHIAIDSDNKVILKVLVERAKNAVSSKINGMTLLEYAVLKGSRDSSRLLLEHGAEANTFDANGTTPLMNAVMMNDTATILNLVEFDAMLNFRDKSGNSALHIAVARSTLSVVRVLAILSADVNSTNNDGESPIAIAVKLNHFPTIEYLIRRGANVHIKIPKVGTLDHLSAIHGSKEALEVLVKANVSINITNENGETPMYFAVEHNKPHIISLLATLGYDINERTDSGDTFLHVAVQYGSLEAALTLLQLGLSPYSTNNNGVSSLTYAIRKNNFTIVRDLLLQSKSLKFDQKYVILASSIGALESLKAMKLVWDQYKLDIHRADWRTGWTPLAQAVQADQIDVLKYLKQIGGNLTQLTNNGNTLVHLAAERGSLKVLRQLVKWGKKVEVFNKNMDTPFWLAAGNGHLDVMMFLKEKGVNLRHRSSWDDGSVLLPAARSGNSAAVFWLINSQGLEVDDADALGQTALHIASECNEESVVRVLLELGASVDGTDIVRETALHKASYFGHEAIVRLLLEYGADVEPTMVASLLTPLHLTSSHGVMSLLLEAGSSRDLQDARAWTPLHWAAYRKNTAMIEKLMDFGFDSTMKDLESNTPSDIARQRGLLNIVEIFKSPASQLTSG